MNRAVYVTRVFVVGIAIFVVFIFLLRHLYGVQITRHDELLTKARKKYTDVRTTYGERGRIYDGCRVPAPNLLAISKGCYDIYGLPQHTALVNKKDLVIEQLVQILGVDKETMSRRFHHQRAREIVVARQVDLKLVDQLKDKELPGLRYVKSTKRYFPKGQFLSQVLGFLNSKGKGTMGIERAYEKELSPQSGSVTVERTRKNERIETGTSSIEEQARDGMDIYLTIKEPIQSIMEEEVAKMVKDHPCKAAYAIMADPKNGDILAMSQWPTYNPNDRSTMNPDNYRNRILEDGIEPGSVMKAVSLAGVLNKLPNINLNSRVYCEKGRWLHAGKILRDAGHNFEWLTVKEIIKHSSNIGTGKLAVMLGKREMYRNLLQFQLGKKTGLKLGTESKGILLKLKDWDKLSLSRYSIGQGLVVTPLQMIQAYCAIANKGKMPQLRMVKKMYNKSTGEFTYNEPKMKHQPIREEVAEMMVTALKTVTEPGGTATKAAVPGFATAGKTGTSQKVEGVYNEDAFVRLVGRNDILEDKILLKDRHDQLSRTITLKYDKSIMKKKLKTAHSFTTEAKIHVKNHKTNKAVMKSARIQFFRTPSGKIRRRISLRTGGFYSDRFYVASFMGFVPADDPRFVLYIVVDEPVKSQGYYGGSVCGPTFKAIASKTLKYMNVFPEQTDAE